MLDFDDREDSLLDEETNAFWLELAKFLEKEDEKVHVLNFECFEKLKSVYELLKKAFDKQDVEISYQLHVPYKSSGSITVCGEDLVASDAIILARAIELIPNIDIYPTSRGNVRMTFSVNDLAVPIE